MSMLIVLILIGFCGISYSRYSYSSGFAEYPTHATHTHRDLSNILLTLLILTGLWVRPYSYSLILTHASVSFLTHNLLHNFIKNLAKITDLEFATIAQGKKLHEKLRILVKNSSENKTFFEIIYKFSFSFFCFASLFFSLRFAFFSLRFAKLRVSILSQFWKKSSLCSLRFAFLVASLRFAFWAKNFFAFASLSQLGFGRNLYAWRRPT